ncbi:ankyrin repeat domain-containing protein [Wolbachia endosymbiont (group A) of Agelastica alni]|uniref:ankyrin repeat domain-containing protein n=1 Tax=Wolbachia endosymbiont (group A) of Agelastica alni TaxID=3066130 RepID=UPI00334069EB
MSDVSIKEERKPYDKSEYFSGTQILDQVNLDFIFINSHCLLDENERINLAKNIHQIGQVFSKYTDNNINSVWIGVFDIRKLDTDEFKERGVQWNYWKNSIHVRFGSSEEKVLVYSWSDTNQFNQDEWNNLLSQLEGDREVKFIGTGPLTLKYKGFNYRVYPPLFSSLDGKEGYLSNTEVFSFSPTEVNQIIEDIKESHQSIEKKIIDHYQSLAKNLAENNKGCIEIKAGINIKNAGIVKNFTDVSYTNKSDDIRNKPIEEAFIKEEERNNVGNLLHLGVYTNNKSFMKQFFGVIDVNEVNKNDRTPLHLAAKYGRKDIVEMLLNKEAKVDVVDNRGRTPLHLAAQYNEKKEIVEMLLNKGAKVDIADNRGRTPLHLAAQNNNKEIVDALIKAKANVDIKDEDEKTPLDLTTNKEIKALLQPAEESDDGSVDGSSTESEGVQEEEEEEEEEEDSNQSQREQDINGEKGADVQDKGVNPVAPTEPAQTEEQPSSFFGSLFSILMKPFSLIGSFLGGFFSWLFGSNEEKIDESTSQTDANVSLLRSDSLDEEDNSGGHYSPTNTDV